MKFFLKRLNNKKGFTLIELIVVIAILAILALIAIPRFAGFTDKAKIAADKEYAALVGNALVVQLAAGDIDLSANTAFSINSAGAVSTAVAGTGFDATELAKLVKAVSLQYYTSMTVTVTSDGSHSVTATNP